MLISQNPFINISLVFISYSFDILGLPLNYTDFEDIDAVHFKSLKWMMENDYDKVEFPETFMYFYS